MLGIPDIIGQLRDVVNTSFKATTSEALGKIPGFNALRSVVENLHRNQEKLLGKRHPNNTVTSDEVSTTQTKLSSEIAGTWNPILIVWNLLRSIFGISRQSRINSAVETLTSYANQYDAHHHVQPSVNNLTGQIENFISKNQSGFSKLGLGSNKKLANNPTFKKLKECLARWIEVYNTLLQGGIKGDGIHTEDKSFLTQIRNRLGSYGKLTQELTGHLDEILNKITQLSERNTGRKLAKAG